MPVAGEYTWRESDAHIELTIPLKGVSPKRVDVFAASSLLKVSYLPFLLDLNLFDEIDEDSSRAVLKNGELILRLKKREMKIWGRLCFEGTKEDIHQRRCNAMHKREEAVNRQMEKVASKKVEEERMVFRRHMALEEDERKRLDDIKVAEKKNAEDAMFEAFGQLSAENTIACVQNKYFTTTISVDHDHLKAKTDATLEPQDLCETRYDFSDVPERDIPPPRATVQTTFYNTPRLFKTPSRESTSKQEQEFIIKNVCNLKKNALLNDIGIGDADPVWLAAKGDEFYSKGDFCSAINAYTEALQKDKTLAQALGKRAACYLNLREGDYCVKDCLAVLNMNEAVGAQFRTVQERQKFQKDTYIRSALAHCLIEDYETGMDHFVKARMLDENDEIIIESMRHLTAFIEATQWKVEADNYFAGGYLMKANDSYSKALSVDPSHLKALINRAACHLGLGNPSDCIDDCDHALSECKMKRKNNNLLAVVLFPKSCVHRKLIVTVLCHRAAAKQIIKEYQGSIADLEEAINTVRANDGIDIDGIKTSIDFLRKAV